MAVAKEQIRQIISENNISSVMDIYSHLKESFKGTLRETHGIGAGCFPRI